MKHVPVSIPHSPALRLLLALSVGIALGDCLYAQSCMLSVSFFSVAIIAGLLAVLLFCFLKLSFSLRWLFGAASLLTITLFGCIWANYRLQQTEITFSDRSATYYALVTDKPERKTNSFSCRAELRGVVDSTGIHTMPSQNILLYFSKEGKEALPQRDDEILFTAQLSVPKPNGNPEEFDYPRFLRRKGIAATAYVQNDHWRLAAHQHEFTLSGFASDCREKLLHQYRQWGFSGDEFAVLAALTVGYKEELSDSIRESFSVSGVSHILALSGLHIGLIYSLLFFIVSFFLPRHTLPGRICGSVLIITALWFFAIFTGLSPSVVRAVIMCSIWSVAKTFGMRAHSLNILCTTAFFMLLFSPFWLFDIGFQLSFVAVAGIILFNPWLYNQLRFTRWLPRKMWSLISISIVAQIATAPLLLYYFSRFSGYFLLANLVVIPLGTMILYLAVLMCALSFIPLVSQYIAYVLNQLLRLFNGVVRVIEGLPYAAIDGVFLYLFDVVCLYLLFFIFLRYLIDKRHKQIIRMMGVLWMILLFRIGIAFVDPPRRQIAFYNVRSCPAVHCMTADKRSWVAYADSVPDIQALRRVTVSYWNRLGLNDPQAVEANYADSVVMRTGMLLAFGSTRVAIVNNNQWRETSSAHPFYVDYLYICKGYTGTLEALLSNFSAGHIVLDASLPYYLIDRLKNECLQHQQCFTVISEQGAYIAQIDA